MEKKRFDNQFFFKKNDCIIHLITRHKHFYILTTYKTTNHILQNFYTPRFLYI